LLDADMRLENHGFDKEKLSHDCYLVDQYSPQIKYGNIRLISNKRDWFYKGVTHEFVTCSGPQYTEGICSTLLINDVGDGGCKDDKFERDKRLLHEALRTIHPNDPLRERYFFYLAQSYFDTGNYSKAIKYYRERLTCEGYPSERWYSRFRIGLSLERLDRWNEAENELLEAYQMMPSRCESLVALAEHYIFAKTPQHHKAGLLIPRLQEMRTEPNTDRLFNYEHYKRYYIDYLTSISAFYTKQLDTGREACQRLLSLPHIPDNIRRNAETNIKFYTTSV